MLIGKIRPQSRHHDIKSLMKLVLMSDLPLGSMHLIALAHQGSNEHCQLIFVIQLNPP